MFMFKCPQKYYNISTNLAEQREIQIAVSELFILKTPPCGDS